MLAGRLKPAQTKIGKSLAENSTRQSRAPVLLRATCQGHALRRPHHRLRPNKEAAGRCLHTPRCLVHEAAHFGCPASALLMRATTAPTAVPQEPCQ
eukprot:364998-Chlamydomonas_euryale.AAC.1